MSILPAPLRAYIGLVATAVETTQELIRRAPELPVEAVGNTMQLSMKVQQRYQELVARGDELLSHLVSPPAKAPSWATFDEEDSPVGASGGLDDDAADTGAGIVGADFGSADLGSTDEGSSDLAGWDLGSANITANSDDLTAEFYDAPATGAVFDDDAHATPTVTHGDPLLAETPVLTLPPKKTGRRSSGGSRRRVATGAAGAPTSADAASSTDGGSPDSAPAGELTGPSNPAPANVDIADVVPMEAVLAELADATPADTVTAPTADGAADGATGDAAGDAVFDSAVEQPLEPTAPAARASARRPATRRPRSTSGAAARATEHPVAQTDPAVAQPSEPRAESTSDPSSP